MFEPFSLLIIEDLIGWIKFHDFNLYKMLKIDYIKVFKQCDSKYYLYSVNFFLPWIEYF